MHFVARTEPHGHFLFKGVWKSEYQAKGNSTAIADFQSIEIQPVEKITLPSQIRVLLSKMKY